MHRLWPSGTDRVETVRAFTNRFEVTLLLKGARTLIGQKGRPLSYNATGTPGMATGGSGDVLTGVCGALLGQHLEPYDAARLGAWLCGRRKHPVILIWLSISREWQGFSAENIVARESRLDCVGQAPSLVPSTGRRYCQAIHSVRARQSPPSCTANSARCVPTPCFIRLLGGEERAGVS